MGRDPSSNNVTTMSGGQAQSTLPEPTTPEQLLSEPDVLRRWPALSRAMLRSARQTGRIGWVRGKRGSPWYRPSAIETFINKELEHQCRVQEPDPYSSSGTNGLPQNRAQKNSTDSGLSQEQEELVAQRLVQKIFNKQS